MRQSSHEHGKTIVGDLTPLGVGSPKNHRILALDPSSTCCGFAFGEVDDGFRGLALVNWGKFDPVGDPQDRLRQIFSWAQTMGCNLYPDMVVYEAAGMPYGGMRGKSYRTYTDAVANARSGIWAANIANVWGVYPQTWKVTVKKKVTIRNVNLKFGLDLKQKDNDTADAIGILDWFVNRMRINPYDAGQTI